MGAKHLNLAQRQERISSAALDEMITLLGIQLPHDTMLEQVLLGTMLLDKEAFHQVNTLVNKDCFFECQHQSIFEALAKLHQAGEPIDLITVTEQLRRKNLLFSEEKLEAFKLARQKEHFRQYATTPYYLTQLTNTVASSAHLHTHAKILYELYMRRKAVEFSCTLVKSAADRSVDIFELYESINKNTRVVTPKRMLITETMNDSLNKGQQIKPKKSIIGNLVQERDIVFLFGDEGTGKSILAFQIGDAASQGTDLFNLEDERLGNECEEQLTILFDFELENDELYNRYSRDKQMYFFHENYIRSYLNPEFLDFEDADTLIMSEIQAAIEAYRPKVIIIDNITFITSEAQDPTIAIKLMKRLKKIQQTYEMTIIVIAHCIKNRDKSMPLESKHMAGASGLKNFAKSIIGVGVSKQDGDKRYIKHLKCRNGRKIFDENNVIECVINKPPGSAMLQFEYDGTGVETAHLFTEDSEAKEQEIMDFVNDLRKGSDGWRVIARKVTEQFNVKWAHTTIQRKHHKWQQECDLFSLPATAHTDTLTEEIVTGE